uniref:Fibroblast growth factor-binding protein 1-like n=2 Tax=Gouania willdenowi TaxID=441366 RepID=A0A8C5H9I7_GOUWI
MKNVQLFSLFLLLLFVTDDVQAKRGQEKSDKARLPPSSSSSSSSGGAVSRAVIGSGELTSKGGHGCTWQTSGEGLVSLVVNCSSAPEGGHTHRYWCRFAGKPELCPNYGLRSSQYWKQLVGKLKERLDVCRGEKILKAKTCKKAPPEAHMKLAESSRQEEEEEEKRKRKEEEEERRRDSEEEGVLNDMEPLQSVCEEGWSSVCSFLLRVFQG